VPSQMAQALQAATAKAAPAVDAQPAQAQTKDQASD
jgi:hypothetical protein